MHGQQNVKIFETSSLGFLPGRGVGQSSTATATPPRSPVCPVTFPSTFHLHSPLSLICSVSAVRQHMFRSLCRERHVYPQFRYTNRERCRNMLPVWKCLYQTSCRNNSDEDSFKCFPLLFLSASLPENTVAETLLSTTQ